MVAVCRRTAVAAAKNLAASIIAACKSSECGKYIFTALRLLIIPGAVYLFCTLLKLDSITPMALIITCMPCGLNTIVFPKLVGEDCRTGARLALISHLIALITIPFWLSLLL